MDVRLVVRRSTVFGGNTHLHVIQPVRTLGLHARTPFLFACSFNIVIRAAWPGSKDVPGLHGRTTVLVCLELKSR